MAKDVKDTKGLKETADKAGTNGKSVIGTPTAKPTTSEERQLVKAATFARVLPHRMNKALKAIKLVGQCSSPNYYFTETQSAKVVEALQVAVRQVQDSFSKSVKKNPSFVLP
jgi:hypothetical protein